MRLPPELEMTIIQAIRRVAVEDSNLKNPEVEALMITICRESYRAGVCAMQEPIKLWEDGPGGKDNPCKDVEL